MPVATAAEVCVDLAISSAGSAANGTMLLTKALEHQPDLEVALVLKDTMTRLPTETLPALLTTATDASVRPAEDNEGEKKNERERERKGEE